MSGTRASNIRRDEDKREFAEEADTLWEITLGPTVWALHFLASYIGAAITCEKLAGEPSLLTFRLAAAVGTAGALALIGFLGWRAWQAWDPLSGDIDDSLAGFADEDRHAFLGQAALLLCGVSFIGVVYTTLPVLVLASCR